MFTDKFLELCKRDNTYPTIVSEKLGFSRQIGAKWAKGAIPRPLTIKKIADYFNVAPSYFDDDSDNKKNAPSEEETLTDSQVQLLKILPTLSIDDIEEILLIANMKAARHKSQDASE